MSSNFIFNSWFNILFFPIFFHFCFKCCVGGNFSRSHPPPSPQNTEQKNWVHRNFAMKCELLRKAAEMKTNTFWRLGRIHAIFSNYSRSKPCLKCDLPFVSAAIMKWTLFRLLLRFLWCKTFELFPSSVCGLPVRRKETPENHYSRSHQSWIISRLRPVPTLEMRRRSVQFP